MSREQFQYVAFISYRHEAVGRKWAMWIQNAIENYRVPWPLVRLGRAPRQLGKCFRDEEELAASSDLSKEIDTALLASKFLIVICTPRTPHSKWVNEEIRRFRELGRGDQILSLLVEGDPRESFPAALLEIRPRAAADDANSDEPGTPIQQIEPLAADIRDDVTAAGGHGRGHMRSMAKLRIIAGLLGVSFDDLYDRNSRRVYGRMLTTAGAALLVAVAMIALSLYAFSQRAEARAQRAAAERERDTAKLVSDFLLDDVLAEANPDVMPRETLSLIREKMIDPAAARVSGQLADRPLVEVEVHDRLGRVYGRLGERERSVAEFGKAFDMAVKHLPVDNVNRNNIAVNYASQLLLIDRATEADPILKNALEASRRSLGDDDLGTIKAMAAYGRCLLQQNNLPAAEPLLAEAYTRIDKLRGQDDTETTYAANEYARVLRAVGKRSDAERLLRQVYDTRRRKLGADHTSTLSALHNLAFVLAEMGQLADAEARAREAVSGRVTKVGLKHLETIASLNLYSRILRQMGAPSDAEKIAAFVVAASADAPLESRKGLAANWAACLDQLKRTEDAARVRREFSLGEKPADQPIAEAKLNDEAAKFVNGLIPQLKLN